MSQRNTQLSITTNNSTYQRPDPPHCGPRGTVGVWCPRSAARDSRIHHGGGGGAAGAWGRGTRQTPGGPDGSGVLSHNWGVAGGRSLWRGGVASSDTRSGRSKGQKSEKCYKCESLTSSRNNVCCGVSSLLDYYYPPHIKPASSLMVHMLGAVDGGKDGEGGDDDSKSCPLPSKPRLRAAKMKK